MEGKDNSLSIKEELPETVVYTDGACLGNPGPGGWAALIRQEGKWNEISGGYKDTTNNRMELLALIRALEHLDRPCRVEAYTDSRYLHDALNKGWLKRWSRNGWRTASKKPVKNQDLWHRLLKELQRHRVSLNWTPAHSGQRENERCDQLAKEQAKRPDLPEDNGALSAGENLAPDSGETGADGNKSIQDLLGYHFRDPQLLQTALIHSSYANEHDGSIQHNERLEFLGDAVLELIISEALYTGYPQTREGELTRMRARLVSESSLAEMARRLGLQEHLYLGRGEEHQGGRERNSVLCDALESIFGAVFLDSGFQEAKRVILRLFSGAWPKRIRSGPRKDAKSRLQEITQKHYQDRPKYHLRESFGPEHAKSYQVELTLPDGRTSTAIASSVKKAEQLAAEKALQAFPDRL